MSHVYTCTICLNGVWLMVCNVWIPKPTDVTLYEVSMQLWRVKSSVVFVVWEYEFHH